MTAGRVYLDWNASAPLRPEARAAMLAAMEECGNPASVHAEGRRARAIVETAREAVAALVGADSTRVVFTSSATEAAAHALTPHWSGGPRIGRLLVSNVEHAAVLSGGRFAAADVEQVRVTKAGIVDLAALAQQLKGISRPLVALMAANNETGIVQPVAEAAALTHAAGGLLVCDAVQAAGRVQTDITALGADGLLLSAHKLGGPKGVGALVLASDAASPAPLLTGGGQERRQRAGTENLIGIAGFGAAAKAALADTSSSARIASLRDALEAALDGCTLACHVPAAGLRLPNTTLVALPGVPAHMLLMQLDLAGFAVSAGAACSSGKIAKSHVLGAMQLPEEFAAGAVRVSLGPASKAEDIDRLIAACRHIFSMRAGRKAA